MSNLSIEQLVNMEWVQQIMEANYRITGASTAILDSHDRVMASTPWQDVCTRFHRAHPGTCGRCRESDAFIKGATEDGDGYLDYQCKNGLRDVAMPIVIAGEHIATFFMGQFFYEDDRPDEEFFRAQAQESGFDEESYLAALNRVPIFTRRQVYDLILYYRNLVYILTEMGIKQLELSEEIAKRRNAEMAQYRVNRALKTLTSCNQVLVQVKSEEELMERICRILVDVGEYPFAWVGFAEDDAQKTVHPMATSGLDHSILSHSLSWGDNERGRGPTGSAIRTGTMSLVRHIATNPAFKPWRDDALRLGYLSCISLPLALDGRVFGAIAIYAREPDAFDAEEISLLKELASDLAYGILSLRRQAENKNLERLLRHAQKMETVGTLARGIAHDFNNILGAIINSVEMALEDAGDPELRELLQDVQKAGFRGRDLVRRISTFSRHGKVESREVDLRTVLNECLKLLAPGIPPKVMVVQHVPETPATISADSTQIHQVIVNLCTNAVQAMKSGGLLELRIDEMELDTHAASRHPNLRPGPYVVLTVQDSGHGMDAEVMERIFDPFFTTKAQEDGSGLGLSVVYGIVKNHGGAILVESVPWKGSTFKVFFPAGGTAPAQEEMDVLPGVPGGSERILLVDDDEHLVSVQQKMLRRLGYRVVAETSPVAALERFRGAPDSFDLVLTDLAMPGMSGADVAREVTRVRPGMPVILATAYFNTAEGGLVPDDVQAAGIREVLKKPTSRGDLASAIRRILDQPA